MGRGVACVGRRRRACGAGLAHGPHLGDAPCQAHGVEGARVQNAGRDPANVPREGDAREHLLEGGHGLGAHNAQRGVHHLPRGRGAGQESEAQGRGASLEKEMRQGRLSRAAHLKDGARLEDAEEVKQQAAVAGVKAEAAAGGAGHPLRHNVDLAGRPVQDLVLLTSCTIRYDHLGKRGAVGVREGPVSRETSATWRTVAFFFFF